MILLKATAARLTLQCHTLSSFHIKKNTRLKCLDISRHNTIFPNSIVYHGLIRPHRIHSSNDEFNYKKPWWSLEEEDQDYEDEEYEEGFFYDESDDEFEGYESWGSGALQKCILQTFGALSWIIPAVLIPVLLGNPAAIVMALFIPFAQTFFLTVIIRVGGALLRRLVSDPEEPMPRRKKTYYGSNAHRTSNGASKENQTRQDESFRKDDSRSNARKNDVPQEKEQTISWTEPGEKTENSPTARPDYGGWEELDNAFQSPPRKIPPKPRKRGGKVSTKLRWREKPLFLRLLVALFPFLGFWERYI